MPALATPTKTRQTTKNTTDDDLLAHLFCGRCWREARAHAQPRRAFCGKEKYVWTQTPKGSKPICVVCTDLTNQGIPCTRCGRKPAKY